MLVGKSNNVMSTYSIFTLFVFSGRTEYQTAASSRVRRSVRFERKPSQRYSRRPIFERREREHELAKQTAEGAAKPEYVQLCKLSRSSVSSHFLSCQGQERLLLLVTVVSYFFLIS